jgi:hypothetical protein
MIALWHGLRRWRWTIAGVAAVMAFAILAGRFWHPYYGFTKFVQLDEPDARNGIPEIRAHPVFVYEGFNGYDGAAYTQIAFHPLLDSPHLKDAVGNVPYRARRILGSALAWLIARGDPARIASIYAGLNLVVWLGLAGLLWRVLEVRDARTWLAWAGVMFSAGALHSVRLALTDLLAATLVTAAIALAERRRMTGALGTLAAAGLARETALANVVGLWLGPWTSGRAWLRNIGRGVAVLIPLLAWILYIRWKAGPADQGFGNFSWPVSSWIEKWSDTLADYVRQPDFRWLNTTTLCALVALTAQAAFIMIRRRGEDRWWRVGASGVVMMAVLGTSVWEGHPGAATRVLLPMSVAFAVFAVRENASPPWLVAGGLSVLSGVLALWHVPHDPRELAAGRWGAGAYIVRLDEGWHGVERERRSAWAWSARAGTLAIETSPRASRPVHLRLRVRALTPRALVVGQGAEEGWHGLVGTRLEWIEIPVTPDPNGRVRIQLRSDAPAVPENSGPASRGLGFAVYGVELR